MSQANVEQMLQWGLEHHQAGRLAEAEHLYRQVLAQAPQRADALNFMGVLFEQTQQYEKAEPFLRRAVAAMPDYPDAHNNLGVVLKDTGRPEEAEPEFRKALALRPAYPEAHSNLGQVRTAQGDREGAVACYRQAVALNPKFATAWNNLGALLMDDRNFVEAIKAFRAAVAQQPNFVEALSSLCGALAESGAIEESVKFGRQALALEPDNRDVNLNLGNALQQAGNRAEGITFLRRALALDPSSADVHWDLGMALLLMGEFKEGWKELEWRWKSAKFGEKPRPFTQPQWKGEDIAGKTILVYQEQGFGDALQFVRYIPLISERGAKVVLECSPLTTRLYATMPGTHELLRPGESIAAFDTHCPFMSLPAALNTTLETIPNKVPYLFAPAEDATKFRARLEALPKSAGASRPFHIGLVWGGNPKHLNDANRSIAAWLLEPLKKVPNVRFVSLQKNLPGRADTKPPFPLVDWTAELQDYADTAGLIANLDLVIAADTSVAHLAGALGKPVWVLVPLVPDWRWLLGRDDTPWYPTMRLFRQTTRGDWAAVIKRLRGELEKFVAGGIQPIVGAR